MPERPRGSDSKNREIGGFNHMGSGELRVKKNSSRDVKYWLFASLAFPVSMMGAYSAGLGTGALLGLVVGQTHSVEGIKLGEGCNTLVLEHHWAPGAVTLPIGDKRSVIFINDKKSKVVTEGGQYGSLLNHELGHGEQVCEAGEGMKIIVHWLADRRKYELDADRRMMVRDGRESAYGGAKN